MNDFPKRMDRTLFLQVLKRIIILFAHVLPPCSHFTSILFIEFIFYYSTTGFIRFTTHANHNHIHKKEHSQGIIFNVKIRRNDASTIYQFRVMFLNNEAFPYGNEPSDALPNFCSHLYILS